jgi:hypothetical protein
MGNEEDQQGKENEQDEIDVETPNNPRIDVFLHQRRLRGSTSVRSRARRNMTIRLGQVEAYSQRDNTATTAAIAEAELRASAGLLLNTSRKNSAAVVKENQAKVSGAAQEPTQQHCQTCVSTLKAQGVPSIRKAQYTKGPWISSAFSENVSVLSTLSGRSSVSDSGLYAGRSPNTALTRSICLLQEIGLNQKVYARHPSLRPHLRLQTVNKTTMLTISSMR